MKLDDVGLHLVKTSANNGWGRCRRALGNGFLRLAPAEIRFLGKHLGWSGADFARKFHCSPSQVSRWESEANPTPMSNAYELLLRTLVAQGEKIKDYQDHMEEFATVEEARPAVLAMIHEESHWRQAA